MLKSKHNPFELAECQIGCQAPPLFTHTVAPVNTPARCSSKSPHHCGRLLMTKSARQRGHAAGAPEPKFCNRYRAMRCRVQHSLRNEHTRTKAQLSTYCSQQTVTKSKGESSSKVITQSPVDNRNQTISTASDDTHSVHQLLTRSVQQYTNSLGTIMH